MNKEEAKKKAAKDASTYIYNAISESYGYGGHGVIGAGQYENAALFAIDQYLKYLKDEGTPLAEKKRNVGIRACDRISKRR